MFLKRAAALSILATDPFSPIDVTAEPKLMKTKQQTNSFLEFWRRIFRQRKSFHDPLLFLSIELFNGTYEWSRGFQGMALRASRLTSDY
jgi:hypothetical protein